MPLYEYRCQQCGCVVEVLLRAKDKAPTKCQKCGGALTKLISSPAIQFKGNGWYITDYAKKNSPAPSETSHSRPDCSETKKPPEAKKEPPLVPRDGAKQAKKKEPASD
jgi:putative FmdB family regulatory protein